MHLTIVGPDQLTIVDGKSQRFDLSVYELPEHFWALQWQISSGHIEYNNETPNEHVTQLPDWVTPILAEHERLTEEQQSQQQASQRQALFINNGTARQQRNEQQHLSKLKREQNHINQFVKERMP